MADNSQQCVGESSNLQSMPDQNPELGSEDNQCSCDKLAALTARVAELEADVKHWQEEAGKNFEPAVVTALRSGKIAAEAERDRLRAAINAVIPSLLDNGWIAKTLRTALVRVTDETTVANTAGPACAHPVGNYRCPTCGIEVRSGEG